MTEKIRKQLKDCHHDAFFWALRCSNQDAVIAEDALQMVYLKILEGKAKFKGLSRFQTWLFSIIHNTVVDLQRSKNLRIIKEEDYGKRIKVATNDEATEFEIGARDIKIGIQQLPKRQQEVMQLRFYHNMTLEEIAETLNISLGSVRQHYDRAKKKMKILLSSKNG